MLYEFECLYDPNYLSAQLGLNCDSIPPFEIFSEYYSNSSAQLGIEKDSRLTPFMLNNVYLQDENNINDLVAVNYIAKFLQHYCPNKQSYKDLDTSGQEAISFYFDTLQYKLDFIKKVVDISGCEFKS